MVSSFATLLDFSIVINRMTSYVSDHFLLKKFDLTGHSIRILSRNMPIICTWLETPPSVCKDLKNYGCLHQAVSVADVIARS
jgi:hypothetical protein